MVLKCIFKKNYLNVLKFYVLKKIMIESLKFDRFFFFWFVIISCYDLSFFN